MASFLRSTTLSLLVASTAITVAASTPDREAHRVIGPLDDGNGVRALEYIDEKGASRLLLKVECPSCPKYNDDFDGNGTSFLYNLPYLMPSSFNPKQPETAKSFVAPFPQPLDVPFNNHTAAATKSRTQSRVETCISQFRVPMHDVHLSSRGKQGHIEVLGLSVKISAFGSDADTQFVNKGDVDGVQLFLSREKGVESAGAHAAAKLEVRDVGAHVSSEEKEREEAERWKLQWWQIVPADMLYCKGSNGQQPEEDVEVPLPSGLAETLSHGPAYEGRTSSVHGIFDSALSAGASVNGNSRFGIGRGGRIGPWNAIQVWMLAAAVVTGVVGLVFVLHRVVRAVRRATVGVGCLRNRPGMDAEEKSGVGNTYGRGRGRSRGWSGGVALDRSE